MPEASTFSVSIYFYWPSLLSHSKKENCDVKKYSLHARTDVIGHILQSPLHPDHFSLRSEQINRAVLGGTCSRSTETKQTALHHLTLQACQVCVLKRNTARKICTSGRAHGPRVGRSRTGNIAECEDRIAQSRSPRDPRRSSQVRAQGGSVMACTVVCENRPVNMGTQHREIHCDHRV